MSLNSFNFLRRKKNTNEGTADDKGAAEAPSVVPVESLPPQAIESLRHWINRDLEALYDKTGMNEYRDKQRDASLLSDTTVTEIRRDDGTVKYLIEGTIALSGGAKRFTYESTVDSAGLLVGIEKGRMQDVAA